MHLLDSEHASVVALHDAERIPNLEFRNRLQPPAGDFAADRGHGSGAFGMIVPYCELTVAAAIAVLLFFGALIGHVLYKGRKS